MGVKKELADFLPISRVARRNNGTFYLDYKTSGTIGYIAPFYGNFLVILKAYAYILLLGKEGLIKTSEHAVLNANYILARLKGRYEAPVDKKCMHECVLSASGQVKNNNVHALDIAKFLIDRGIHPPTIYFPLIVKEALMIEPTETESKETLDYFIDCMIEADRLSKENPDALKAAPKTMPITRLDETKAARDANCALL